MNCYLKYYGGKWSMLHEILPLIPRHVTYCEPFLGSGAVWTVKPEAPVNILGDKNELLINFYVQSRTNFKALNQLIQSSLHSESMYKEAQRIYRNPPRFSKVKRAWATWLIHNLSWAGDPGGGFQFSIKERIKNRLVNKKLAFEELELRFENAEFFCRDAIDLIGLTDTESTFSYLDPPYLNADQGPYSGYTAEEYIKLLDLLKRIKGMFLLSSYPNPLLKECVDENAWNYKEIERPLCTGNKRKTKTETLTWNYTAPLSSRSLFEKK
jgi:DNA adenine methylase